MAEELAGDVIAGKRPTCDREEPVNAPRGRVVDQLRKVRFPGTGFTLDQHCYVVLGRDAELLDHRGERWRVVDELPANPLRGTLARGIGERSSLFESAARPVGKFAHLMRPRPPRRKVRCEVVERPQVPHLFRLDDRESDRVLLQLGFADHNFGRGRIGRVVGEEKKIAVRLWRKQVRNFLEPHDRGG